MAGFFNVRFLLEFPWHKFSPSSLRLQPCCFLSQLYLLKKRQFEMSFFGWVK